MLEVMETSASFGESGARTFRCPKPPLNSLSSAPSSGLKLWLSVVLTEPRRYLNQPATIPCDRSGLHGENLAVGNSACRTGFLSWAKNPSDEVERAVSSAVERLVYTEFLAFFPNCTHVDSRELSSFSAVACNHCAATQVVPTWSHFLSSGYNRGYNPTG